MGVQLNIKKSTNPAVSEAIKVNPNSGKASATLNVIRFVDKDTKQYVLYIPSIDISGYGETTEKANEILNFSITEFFTHLLASKKSDIDKELRSLGWKHKPMFKKEYSKVYVDIDGVLKNFNAEENSIEHLTLTAA